jgi:hypothetical protein
MHDGNQFLLSVARIESTFEDGLNEPRLGSASGFFVLGKNRHAYLVTNKHNVDPRLKLRSANHRLTRLAVEVRLFEAGIAQAKTAVVELPLDERRLVHHATSDVSVYDTNDVPLPAGFAIAVWAQQDTLADGAMHSHLQAMDLVSFIGFPGGTGAPWLDEMWRTPIARLASIASVPAVPFSHKSIGTSDVTLVNGLSFQGSSGSMVVSHPRDQSVVGRNAVSTKIVGIMSGGWRERDLEVANSNAAFGPHSGVSYYTRSTAILEVLHQAMSLR